MPENQPKLTVLHSKSPNTATADDDDLKEIQNTPPAHLDDEASRLWKAVVPEIKKIGYLKKIAGFKIEVQHRLS